MHGPLGMRARTAIVVLIDAHSAVISHFGDGTLRRIRSIAAPATAGATDHMGNAPRQAFHPGTRGETARDAAQRARANARREFIHAVAPVVAAAAGRFEWIVVGGNRLYSLPLEELLMKSHERAVIPVRTLTRTVSTRLIIQRVAAAIQARIDEQNLADVQGLLERTGAHTTGVVGAVASIDAAARGAAETILMTRHYQELHPADVEQLVAAASTHNEHVVTVAGGAADLLDAQAGGVGALLRYAPYRAMAGTE